MNPTFLSVIGLALIILNANGIISVDWWITFAPIIVDVILSMLKAIERQASRDAFIDALQKAYEIMDEEDDLK